VTGRYTEQQLQELFQRIGGGSHLWVPQTEAEHVPSGPTMTVYFKYSEVFPEAGNAQNRYWEMLQTVPVVNAIGVFASISNILSITAHDQASHRALHEQFLDPETAERVAKHAPGGSAFSVVFHRLASIGVIRNLVLYGTNRQDATDAPLTSVGTLALCANEFLQREPIVTGTPNNLELATQFAATWDVNNPRDVAYALTRMHTILTEILPGTDPTVVTLRQRIGFNAVAVDGLTLSEFLAIVFGLWAYGNKVIEKGIQRVLFQPSEILREFPSAEELLKKFLAGRAVTLDQLAEKLRTNAPQNNDGFLQELASKNVLTTSLTTFRQQPLLQLDDGRVVILDLQFLADLLTSGIYHLLFSALPGEQRKTFRELWGRLFEIYVTNLLRVFYPTAAGLLSVDVQYAAGQIDALLDFGSYVFVLEIKASQLTEAAKRSGDPETLAKDIEEKFVRTNEGEAKAVVQLARAAKAIQDGTIRTATKPRRVYPILVTDEPALESFGFNAYLNELFQKEIAIDDVIRPLTAMSVNECEEILPYTTSNAFSWAELCESRFQNTDVRIWSVHQAIYNLRHQKRVGVLRNEYLLKRFEAIYRDILTTYGKK
jgi:hypothetical protein